MMSQTRYATSGDVELAYRVWGEGPHDIVLILDWMSHVEVITELPDLMRYLERLSSFGRVVMTDMRGIGASDPVPYAETRREDWVSDVAAVMAAAGSTRATVVGMGHAGQVAMLFAAEHPEATAALILINSYARLARADDYRAGLPPSVQEQVIGTIAEHYGDGSMIRVLAPSLAAAPGAIEWWAKIERLGGTPRRAVAKQKAIFTVDIRDVPPRITVPTLLLHSKDHLLYRPALSQYLAEHIAGAVYREVPGTDHWPIGEDVWSSIQEFITGERPAPEMERELMTLLFTDLVGSTEKAATLGDHAWRNVLASHNRIQKEQVAAHRGRIIDWAGDGVLATFDAPARAIRCAVAVRAALRPLGLDIRAGVHTGEVEVDADRVRGINVHIGARVAAAASAGQILVSSTVRDLAGGSGFRFEDRGMHALKGVSEEWRLFAVAG
jgi:class 3 adenylate cyclase